MKKEKNTREKMRRGFNGISPRALSRARALTTSATAGGPEILAHRKVFLKGSERGDFVSSSLERVKSYRFLLMKER